MAHHAFVQIGKAEQVSMTLCGWPARRNRGKRRRRRDNSKAVETVCSYGYMSPFTVCVLVFNPSIT